MSSPTSGSEQPPAFDLLAPSVQRWVWDQGWQSLRPVQEQAIRVITGSDTDAVISAPTAGGKTEAAILPLVSTVLARPQDTPGFQLACVSPLRALINDQARRLESLGEATGLAVHPWHGDVPRAARQQLRQQPQGILIITPESLEAMLLHHGTAVPRLFAPLKATVIDELHALLDTERGIHLRSLLARLETAVGRRVRRIGLSATLSQMDLVRQYLRPSDPQGVAIIQADGRDAALQAQLRAYRQTPPQPNGKNQKGNAGNTRNKHGQAHQQVASHIFQHLRGASNLVFAGSRQNVEWYADRLRLLSDRARVPLDFFPHHASLSRDHRSHLEHRLRTRNTTTAVCTSTLELGIDIGDIESVAQIGAPFTVASLRHRLGRSGRRPGQPMTLRVYIVETDPGPQSHPIDHLHLGLVRATAMLELLVSGWCEPPAPQALHLSTLVHQILSLTAQHGGSRAQDLYQQLCRQGPFSNIDVSTFAAVLRQLGSPDIQIIEQTPDGALLPGSTGEKLVNHHTFYAVYQTPDEYRVNHAGRPIGTLPMRNILRPGMGLILAGQRWRVTGVDDQQHTIDVVPDTTGTPPSFTGDPGTIHDQVARTMRTVLEQDTMPAYLDRTARQVLQEARQEYRHLGLHQQTLRPTSETGRLLATWQGTARTGSLALALQALGHTVTPHDALIEAHPQPGAASVESSLEALTHADPDTLREQLRPHASGPSEKFHHWLGPDLIFLDNLSSRLDLQAVPEMARALLQDLPD